MNDRLTTVKNLIWAVAIVICIVAVLVGLIFAMTQKYNGETQNFTLDLGSSSNNSPVTAEDVDNPLSDSVGIQRGELHTLNEIPDVGEGYIYNLTFLVDSTFMGLRSKGLVGGDQVWATASGSLPISSLDTAVIKFPNDGSEISPVNAAMISKPSVLVIGIGTDGLSQIERDSFISKYDKLIRDIQSASPDTSIICMGLCSITEDYSGVDGLNITAMSDGNDWVQLVCRDTGVWYADVAENLGDGSGGLRASYAESNGKTLNTEGLNLVLSYLRTHALQ